MKEEVEFDKPPIVVKPSFEQLTSHINMKGHWNENVEDTLKKYFINQDINDNNLKAEIGKIKVNKAIPCNLHSVYLTILALFVLKEVFVDREEEWQLLAQKAKTLLRNCGITKPEGLLR